MDTNSAKDELRNAADHAKEALRATLLAARSALDLAIQKLDERDSSGGDASGTGTPPAPSGVTQEEAAVDAQP